MELNPIFALGEDEISWSTNVILTEEVGATVSKFKDKAVFVNVETLIRNAIAAFESNNENDYNSTIRDRIEADIRGLKDYIERDNGGLVVVYRALYDNIIRGNNFIQVKTPNTIKQILNKERTDYAIKHVEDLVDIVFKKGIVNPNLELYRDVYLVTHIGYDLLPSNKFARVKLLESFSGEEYSSKDFNRKLGIPKEYREYIPLNKLTLLVFGDNALITKVNKDTPKRILAIAKEASWTPLTTESRCMFTISQRDKPLADLLHKLTR